MNIVSQNSPDPDPGMGNQAQHRQYGKPFNPDIVEKAHPGCITDTRMTQDETKNKNRIHR